LTEKQRNKLLVDMTDSVGELVLKNNYRQTQAISIAHNDVLSRMEEYRRLISVMESAGKLNRELEFLPQDDVIKERKSANDGFTRPELSDVVFPTQITRKHHKPLHEHRLRREIISTQVANDMVNHMGVTFVERLKQSTGASSSSIALSYIIARDVFNLDKWWEAIEGLDHVVPSSLQTEMMSALMSMMRRACRWLIRNRRSELNVTENMDRFKIGIEKISKSLPTFLTGTSKKEWEDSFKSLVAQNVPEDIAATVAGSGHLYAALGIIEAQEEGEGSLEMVANIYYLLGNRLVKYH